jgi:glycosyltransferase involved in cell wall biosynthesis
VKQLLGIDARTLYPPVVDPAPPLPWSERTSSFVALGRISPEKEYERAIRILARVRRHLPDLTLTIVGTWDRHTRRYLRQLQRLALSFGSWVQFRNDLTRQEVRELLSRTRFGIHAMRDEHFGMAPAEMVRAGMIVWVPTGGGQVEIVGEAPALLYDTEEEAAETIVRIATSSSEQDRWREHLASRAARFGSARFMNEVREIVTNFRE